MLQVYIVSASTTVSTAITAVTSSAGVFQILWGCATLALLSIVSNNSALTTLGVVGRTLGSSSFMWVGSATEVTLGCSFACCFVVLFSNLWTYLLHTGTRFYVSVGSNVGNAASARVMVKLYFLLFLRISRSQCSVVQQG